MNKNCKYIIFFLSFITFLIAKVNLDEPFSNFKSDKNYYPVKNIDSKILIDGKLNEAIWDSLKIIDDFMQIDPNIFSLPSQKTSVRIFYNDESLYFGVKIYDDPDKVVGNLAQYDDWFEGFYPSPYMSFVFKFKENNSGCDCSRFFPRYINSAQT